MPGVKACGRCGSLLRLDALAISVHPPRATAWAKRWRRWVVRTRMTVQDAARAAFVQLIHADVYDAPAWPVLCRAIVPGWPQFYQGQRLRGCCFLGVYAILMSLALAMLGSDLGSLFLGFALAAHASSVLDVALPATREADARLARIVALLVVVGTIAYMVPIYIVTQLAWPQRINATTGPLVAGDAVLVNTGIYRLRLPQPGDTVLYELPDVRAAGRYRDHAANFVFQGQRIDRIIAGPEEQVHVEGGNLFVDGRPSTHVPLDTSRLPKKLDIKVPAGCYLILPTTTLAEGMDLERLDWARASIVPAERIVGRVWLRHWPWSRFRFL